MINNMQDIASDHNDVHWKCSYVQKYVEWCKPVYEVYFTIKI